MLKIRFNGFSMENKLEKKSFSFQAIGKSETK